MASVVLPEDFQGVADHPYFPTKVDFPGYAPPAVSLIFLLGTFFAGVAILLVTAWCITGITSAGSKLITSLKLLGGLTGEHMLQDA